MTVHALFAIHLRAAVIESSAAKCWYCWWIACVASAAITRCRYMCRARRDIAFTCGIHAIMTGNTGQTLIAATAIKCRVVEARDKTAAGLMTMLAAF